MQSREGLILLAEQGTVLWVNHPAAELLGYTLSEFQQMELPLKLENDGRDSSLVGPVAIAFNSLLDGKETAAEGDARFPTKDGKRLAVHWRLWALPAAQAGKQILLSISRAQSSASGTGVPDYRDVFEHAVEGFFRATPEGQLTEANPALARMFGFKSPEELVAALNSVDNRVYVNPERRIDFVRTLLERGSVAGFEMEVYRADRRVIWITTFARTVLSANLDPLYLEGNVIDITDRKQAEAALKRSEERFRRLAETTRFVPFEFNASSRTFTYFGPQAETLFGSSFREGLTLDAWAAIVVPDDREQGLRFARGPAFRTAENLQAEFRVNVANGRLIWVRQIVNRNVTDESADNVRGFLLDVTETKNLEEERERSRNQLRDLGARNLQVREEERANVAREIHDELGQALTLLRIDLNWLSLRVKQTVSDEARKPMEEKIGTMEQLIHWTLETVRRILSALRPPLLDELGLKAALEFHLEDFSKRTAIRYEFEANSAGAISASSATAVFRIFQEILTNIARHSGASRVKVFMGESGGKLLFKVQDNGRGISQEKLLKSRSFGLLGMEERAWAIGGELEIVGSPRSGTTVTLLVPLVNSETA